ncbi:MAG: beta-lactamase family protein [Archangiaceae bacterium]|nr:beta-lactamase family protein [Archangiaceae bacterium]
MKVLEAGVTEGVFPLARAEVIHRGKQVISAGNAPEEMHFDLASLTKVMSTTALFLDLLEERKLGLETRVAGVTAEDLLFHRSGLPAFLPFFAEALATWPQLQDAKCPPETRAAARAHVVAAASSTPRSARRGAVYSDLGFIVLGELVARVGGAPLDALFVERMKNPLGLSATYRRLSASLPLPNFLAATGATRPREPAPGQEGLWSVPPKPTRQGEVDDDNAWAMDGVSGHAGLFGTARDVALYGQAVLEGRFRAPQGWGRDRSTPGSTRALGFDTPSDEASSAGPRFGKAGPLGAIGHTGFTGTSLWVDLDRELVVALCTNRVALGRANVKIRDFRPRFHQAVLDELHL